MQEYLQEVTDDLEEGILLSTSLKITKTERQCLDDINYMTLLMIAEWLKSKFVEYEMRIPEEKRDKFESFFTDHVYYRDGKVVCK